MDFGVDVVEALKAYGIIPTILGIVVVYLLKSYLSTFISYLWSKVTFKKKPADLNKHPAFHQLENFISVKIPGMSFEDQGRDEVFRDMINIMFKSYIDMMHAIITQSVDIKGESVFTSNDDFIQKMSSYAVRAITEYENQWRKSGVPLVCITKFNDWHSNKRDALFPDIQIIANSAFHESYNEKIAAFFDEIFMVLNFSILDAEYILTTLNGELTGQTYKGILIGHGPEGILKPGRSYSKKKSQIINFREEN